MLHAKLLTYEFDMGRKATLSSVALLLSRTLYSRRFFPYYTFNILGGLDENADGVVYGYDAIGSYEPRRYIASGSATSLILPILD